MAQPTPRDILLGRGKNTRDHKGNIRLVMVCAEVSNEYESLRYPAGSPLAPRSRIVARVVHYLTAVEKRRFLTEENQFGERFEAAPKKIHEKVRACIVSIISAKKKKKNNQEAPGRLIAIPDISAFSASTVVSKNLLQKCVDDVAVAVEALRVPSLHQMEFVDDAPSAGGASFSRTATAFDPFFR